MDWNWYLFGFHGRINRAKYWLATAVCVGWMIFSLWMVVLAAGLLGAAGLLPDKPYSIDIGVEKIFALLDPATYHSPSRSDLVGIAGSLISVPLVLWIYLATSIKRLHDRDRSGWWMVPFMLLPGLVGHFSGRLGDHDGYGLIALAAGLLYLWGAIEMYLLKGSPRTNGFGPSPLPKTQSRPRAEHTSWRGRSGWNQDNEIEFVPTKGSPSQLPHVNRKA
ncbi:MAG TPA: DUF805 domain-containing protein [Bradyrhizobium sp.]|nr:DUF805 domain-containing protein [Bradyrhizobium sp.]